MTPLAQLKAVIAADYRERQQDGLERPDFRRVLRRQHLEARRGATVDGIAAMSVTELTHVIVANHHALEALKVTIRNTEEKLMMKNRDIELSVDVDTEIRELATRIQREERNLTSEQAYAIALQR